MTRVAAPAAALPVDRWAARLLDQGWCAIPRAAPLSLLEGLDRDLAIAFEETPFCRGGFYGERTKRFGRLLVRSHHAAPLVMHPLVLGLAKRVLGPWCDRLQLNLTQAVALHPGALAQLPHRDQDMWRGETGRIEYLVNVMWPLTPFTRENGATLVWPGSHGGNLHDDAKSPLAVELAPGDALVFLGSTLHGGGENRSREVRRGVIVSYCLGWLKPYENQWLAYPPEVARRFPPDVAALVGYCQHRPNLGNYEGQCPSVLLKEGPAGPPAAADALRPDQKALVAHHVARQAAARSP